MCGQGISPCTRDSPKLYPYLRRKCLVLLAIYSYSPVASLTPPPHTIQHGSGSSQIAIYNPLLHHAASYMALSVLIHPAYTDGASSSIGPCTSDRRYPWQAYLSTGSWRRFPITKGIGLDCFVPVQSMKVSGFRHLPPGRYREKEVTHESRKGARSLHPGGLARKRRKTEEKMEWCGTSAPHHHCTISRIKNCPSLDNLKNFLVIRPSY